MSESVVVEGLQTISAEEWAQVFSLEQKLAQAGRQTVEESFALFVHEFRALIPVDTATLIFTSKVDGRPQELGGWRTIWVHSPTHGKVLASLQKTVMRLAWGEKEDRRMLQLERNLCAEFDDVENDSSYDGVQKNVARKLGAAYRLGINVHINPLLMAFVIFQRGKGEPAFTREQAHQAIAVAQALSAQVYRWAGLLGILHCGEVLSARERDVLLQLLSAASNEEGASVLGVRPSYFHQVAVKLHKKFGVNSRPQLLALFHEKSAEAGPVVRAKSGTLAHPARD